MRNQITLYCLLGLLMLSSEGFAQATILSFDDVTGEAEATAAGAVECDSDSRDFCGATLSFDGGFVGGTVTVDANSQADGDGDDYNVWYDLVTVKQGGIGASAVLGGPTSGDDNAVGQSDWIEVEFASNVTLSEFWMVGEHQGLPNSNVKFHVGGVGGTTYDATCSSTQGDGLNGQDGSGNKCNFSEDSADVTGSRFAFSAASGVNFYLAGLAFEPADCPVDPVLGTCVLVTTIEVPDNVLGEGGVIKQFAPRIELDPRSNEITGQCSNVNDDTTAAENGSIGPVDGNGSWWVPHPNPAFTDLIEIPYWMCGSPYVAFIATEKDFEIPFGVIDHEFPPNLPAGNDAMYQCDIPSAILENDLSYQTIFAYVTDVPADVIGARMLELTTGCTNPPKGKSGSLSVLAAGFHIDWRTTDAGTVNDAYLTLLLEKADALRTAIDEAAIAGVISGRNLRQLRNAARVAEEKLISGDCRLASRKLETVINRAGRFTFGFDPNVNHQGRIVARASNMVFTNDNKYCPFQ